MERMSISKRSGQACFLLPPVIHNCSYSEWTNGPRRYRSEQKARHKNRVLLVSSYNMTAAS